jgi:DNA processing protein
MKNKIYLNNDKYPGLLKQIGKEAPKQLYYKGNISLLDSDCLAVVGSRKMTTYGRQVTEKLVGQIASSGVTIVSGFMYGVDATAHKTAVEVGGKTIAVMPCGIDRIHPEYQVKLYNDILENNGLIISEYESDMQPGYWTYPARNRIVAGISKATLVIEAGEKSGSLITANLAIKFNRKLFAVPGPITSVNSFGTNDLIKENKAEIVLDAKNILDFFNNELREGRNERLSLSQREAKPLGKKIFGNFGNSTTNNEIIQLLLVEPVEIDVLARKLNKNIQEISKQLSFMEIKGLVKKENNKYYVS